MNLLEKLENYEITTAKNTNISLKDVETALVDCSELFDIFNHSHTQFNWKLQNVTHASDARNIRQLAAELNSKKRALEDNKFNFIKKKLKLKIKIEKAEKKKLTETEKQLLDVEIAEMESQMEFLRIAYEGAMKDVMVLFSIYNELKEKVIKKYGKLDEEVLELEEGEYWIKRLITQSLRQVRMTGRIDAGNQEALEQIGINPSSALTFILDYLNNKETKTDDVTLDDFLERCIEKYKGCSDKVLEKRGISSNIIKDNIYLLEDEN